MTVSETHNVYKNLSFEYWVELYKNNPDAFDEKRLEVLGELVTERFPDDNEKQNRMLALINRQDMELHHIKNPIERLNQVQVKFWEQVLAFQKANQEFLDIANGTHVEPADNSKHDNVVEFKKKDDT